VNAFLITNIIAAIDFADSTLSISPDSGVDLNKKFNIKFNNQTLGVYFDFLEGEGLCKL
jgi:hypothetical protein